MMDYGWDSSDDEGQQMKIDLEPKQDTTDHKAATVVSMVKGTTGPEESSPQTNLPTADDKPKSLVDDYDPSQPSSDNEDACIGENQNHQSNHLSTENDNVSDYDPADPTNSDDEVEQTTQDQLPLMSIGAVDDDQVEKCVDGARMEEEREEMNESVSSVKKCGSGNGPFEESNDVSQSLGADKDGGIFRESDARVDDDDENATASRDENNGDDMVDNEEDENKECDADGRWDSQEISSSPYKSQDKGDDEHDVISSSVNTKAVAEISLNEQSLNSMDGADRSDGQEESQESGDIVHKLMSSPPQDADDSTQVSNISMDNNNPADDGGSDVPEVAFDDDDFVLEKEPFQSTDRPEGLERDRHGDDDDDEDDDEDGHSQKRDSWKSSKDHRRGDEETENLWKKYGSDISEDEITDTAVNKRGEEVANQEEALVDLFREESEPDRDELGDREAEKQPVKKSKKKLGTKKIKKKGKKLKKGQGSGKKESKSHENERDDERYVEISRGRPSIESQEDGELEGENMNSGRKKRSHEERHSFSSLDHAGDARFGEDDEQMEPGEIVETLTSDGKKKGGKKKEKKERKKKKARREVATIEDGNQGDDDSQKFPSFLAGFFVQDDGEEAEEEEVRENFGNNFDEERAFHKNLASEKNYRKHQDSGQEEESLRSFEQGMEMNENHQERRADEVEQHRSGRSRKHDERRHETRESRERQMGSRDVREVRYERERRELMRDAGRERSRSDRGGRERGRDREKERERERERLRRPEDGRRRRVSRSRSAERRHRSRSLERNRRSRSRDRSSRQRRRRTRSRERSVERERERERDRERERSKRRRKERSQEREMQRRRVRRASPSRSRSPRRRGERAGSNKENRDESHRRRRVRYPEESESEPEREINRRSSRQRERERSSSSSSSSQSSDSRHVSLQNVHLVNYGLPVPQSSEDEGANSDVILIEPEKIVIDLDELEDPPSSVDITHANADDDNSTFVDGQSIPAPPGLSGSTRRSALIQINPRENREEEGGDATPTRDEVTDIVRSKKDKAAPSAAVPESDYDPAHPTEEDVEPELSVSQNSAESDKDKDKNQEVSPRSPAEVATSTTATTVTTTTTATSPLPPAEKGPVPPAHPPPEEVRPSPPPPVPQESTNLETAPPTSVSTQMPSMPSNPVMRLINPLLLQQQPPINHQGQPGLLPFPNLPGGNNQLPPRFMNWALNNLANSGQLPPRPMFGPGGQRLMLPNTDGPPPGFRGMDPSSGGGRPPFSSNSLNNPPPLNVGPHGQMPISSMAPLAQLTSLLPALEKAKMAAAAAQDNQQMPMFNKPGSGAHGNSLLGKPPLSASFPSNMTASVRMSSSQRGGRSDLSESTEVVDMDMSPGDEDCELELPSPNSDSSGSKEGRRRRGRRSDHSHRSKKDSSKSLAASSSNKGVIQPVVYLKALSKAIEKLAPKGQMSGAGGASSHDRSKQKKKKTDVDDDVPASAVDLTNKEKFMKKLHLQERVIDEVKLAIKPFYASKKINKDQYKLILRKAVPKVCHSKSGNINPQKIQQLVEAYVKGMCKGAGAKGTPKKKKAHGHGKDGPAKDNATNNSKDSTIRQNGERPKKAAR